VLKIRVVNARDSLDTVPIIPFYVPLGQPLKEHMFWCAMALDALANGGEDLDLLGAKLCVAREG
jgi:hypothetical protein